MELFNSLDRALNRIDRLVAGENLAANDNEPPRLASTLIHLCDVRGGAAIARKWSRSPRAPEALPPRRGKAAMSASGLAAPFLTRLDAVSSLSFARHGSGMAG